MAQLLRKLKRAILNSDPSFCDMYEDAHARTAAGEYLAHIQRHLRERFGNHPLTILDAGCQAGRLLIPLAEEGHRLIGVDASGFGLRRARRHARARRLPIRLHLGGIAKLRQWVGPGSVDAVICTEVLYLCKDYRELFRLLVESVKPGGLMCVSHRPAAFYVATALREGHRELAADLARRREGQTAESRYHNWQTEGQLREWYQAEGLRVVGCYPVDHAIVRLPAPAIALGGPGERAALADPDVAQLLSPAHETDSTYRIPAYLLMVAYK